MLLFGGVSLLLFGGVSLRYCLAVFLCATVWLCFSVLLFGDVSLCHCFVMFLVLLLYNNLTHDNRNPKPVLYQSYSTRNQVADRSV